MTSTRAFLIDLVNSSADEFLRENATLDAIEHGMFSREDWKAFATQRYLAALPFERLLIACRDAASAQGDRRFVDAVDANLRDEIGMDASGNVRAELSHTTWRRDFYGAIGIEEASLSSSTRSNGTIAYESALNTIIDSADLAMIGGAILLLEGLIPREFVRIKVGRDIAFPLMDAKARLYLDDHILHDAKFHYPDLLAALEPYAKSEKSRPNIVAGVRKIVEAKTLFYQGWR